MMFYQIEPLDELLAGNLLVKTFSFFLQNFIERRYQEFDRIETVDDWYLKKEFKEKQIHLPEDQMENKTLKEIFDKKKLRELIAENCYFYGYQHSVYDYVQF